MKRPWIVTAGVVGVIVVLLVILQVTLVQQQGAAAKARQEAAEAQRIANVNREKAAELRVQLAEAEKLRDRTMSPEETTDALLNTIMAAEKSGHARVVDVSLQETQPVGMYTRRVVSLRTDFSNVAGLGSFLKSLESAPYANLVNSISADLTDARNAALTLYIYQRS